MSTAEVYGAPPGAPYREEHEKRPSNAYGRMKWAEEQDMMAAHGRPTAHRVLRVTALRTWTIVMVDVDDAGHLVSTRNYNEARPTEARATAAVSTGKRHAEDAIRRRERRIAGGPGRVSRAPRSPDPDGPNGGCLSGDRP